MARRQPSTFNVIPTGNTADPQAKPATRAALGRGEARPVRRSGPLTPGEFKALRRLAELGINPLRHV